MRLRGTNQDLQRPYNRRIVLEYIRTKGPATRAAIAQGVGLTVQTVSTIVRELEELGYLRPEKQKPKGRGAPTQTLHLNPNGGYAIGLYVSPLGVSAGLMNLGGEMIISETIPSLRPTPDEAFDIIDRLIAQMRNLRPEGRLLGVGLTMPGPFDVEAMAFVGPTTMNGWAGVPIRERLAEVTGLPTFLEVDMASAALGVQLYGEGIGFRSFYYLHMGAGLGGCMVHDGKLLRGAWGNAGEVGHIPMVPDGLPCACGNCGCLERYISLEGFAERPEGQSEDDWVSSVAPIFHRAITTIENLFDPETIILGGIAPPHVIQALVASTNSLPTSISARADRASPRVIAAPDSQSVLRGAAALAVSGVLSPQQQSSNDSAPGAPFSQGMAA